MTTLNIAKQIHTVYLPTNGFPEWVLNQELWSEFEFDKTVVYYHKEDDLEKVKQMVKEREPCNINMRRIYFGEFKAAPLRGADLNSISDARISEADSESNEKDLVNNFGWRYGAYQYSTVDQLMPNIAIYCHATVLRPTGYKKVHVINLVGYAFDCMEQPDYQYFKTKPNEYVIDKYYEVWHKAFVAAVHLKRSGKIDKIKIFNVGGGAFSGLFEADFIEHIFEPAFLPFIPSFEAAGIEVLGYNQNTQRFDGGFIPDTLDIDTEMEKTLYVNAWDPWSLIGNGNERDESLDGYWGRCSNMAVLGWSLTNTEIKYCAV